MGQLGAGRIRATGLPQPRRTMGVRDRDRGRRGGCPRDPVAAHLWWLWRAGDAERIGAWAEIHSAATVGLAAAVAGGLYATVARLIFHGRPLLIDEIVQVRQAQIFASGHLWLPVRAHPEFFSSLHMVDAAGKVYSQFPPGGPALLALGVLAGATWIVGPLCGVISVLAFASFARIAEPSRRIAVAATVLFGLAPFTMFMAGSHMNHVTALTCILIGAAALVHATADPDVAGGAGADPAPGPRSRTRARWLAFLSGSRIRGRRNDPPSQCAGVRRAGGAVVSVASASRPSPMARRDRGLRRRGIANERDVLRQRPHDRRTAAVRVSGAVGAGSRSRLSSRAVG